MRWLGACAALLVGCGANLSDQPASTSVDAPAGTPGGGSGGSGGGGGGGVMADASVDAPACFNGRVVFLNFDGVTLAKTTTTDSTQNQAAWIGVTTATVPAYQAGAANRTGQIQTITAGVQQALAAYPITVVTTRPASGQYVMIAFGGTKTDVGTGYGYATADHDCGDIVKNDVGWVSDTVPSGIVVPVTIGTIGWALGLQGTMDTHDCMCGWANSCQWSGASTCTLGTAIATTQSNAPATTCQGLATQDEKAAFSTAFCQ